MIKILLIFTTRFEQIFIDFEKEYSITKAKKIYIIPYCKTIPCKLKQLIKLFTFYARIWVDAIINPLDTRKWISAGIESANHSPITDKFNLGVIQV